MRKRAWYHYLIAIAILAALWEVLAFGLDIPAFPHLNHAIGAFVDGMVHGDLPQHFAHSLYRVAMATAIALVLGVPLGLWLGRSGNPVGQVLIYVTYPIPKVVFLPVIMVAMGLGDTSKIFLIWLVIFFQIVVTVMDAAASVPPGLIRSVQSLGGSEWHIYRHVIFPATLAPIFTALRLSTGTAVAVLFFAETYATEVGLGALVWNTWASHSMDEMYAGIIAMAIMGFGFYVLLEWIERLACPWAESRR